MNDKRLMIVGASARAAAFSALRCGFVPVCADLFADADLLRVCDAYAVENFPVDLGANIKQSKCNHWIYTGALENRPNLLQSWSESTTLLGNSAGVVRSVRSPQILQECLRHNGLPSVNTKRRLEPTDDRSQWIRKPVCSAAGQNIDFADQVTEDSNEDYYYQQFVNGNAYSAVFVAAKRRSQLLGVTKQLIGTKWCGVSGFRYAGSVGPIRLAISEAESWSRIGSALASKFDLHGLFGVDAIVNQNGIWTVEVNPRYTASIEVLELADSSIESIRRHVTACRDHLLTPFEPANEVDFFAKAILFAEQRVQVAPEFTERILRANRDSNTLQFADIPHRGTLETGWPILSIFGRGKTASSAIKEAKTSASAIKASLAPSTKNCENEVV